MNAVVLDSFALIAFLEDEPGREIVEHILDKCLVTGENAFISVVNWGEVYYTTFRTKGEKSARLALDVIRTLPIEIINIEQELTFLAAQYKAKHKMSFADAFAAALAKAKHAELITGDPEFAPLGKDIKIRWLAKHTGKK